MKVTWVLLITAGIALAFVSLVAPLIQQQAYFSTSGPAASVQFNSSVPYWTDTFGIPPMNAGEVLQVEASRIGTGNVTIQIVGYGPGDTMPESFTISLDNQVPSVSANLTVHRSAAYIFLVTSYYARYTILVGGVWSVYYGWRVWLYWGIVLILCGVVSMYYYRIIRRKEAMFRKALEGLTPPK